VFANRPAQHDRDWAACPKNRRAEIEETKVRHRTKCPEIAEAQAMAQLQALERLRKNLKH